MCPDVAWDMLFLWHGLTFLEIQKNVHCSDEVIAKG